MSHIIARDKPRQQVVFGHKVWLDEVDGGIVSDYRVLVGNPPDAPQLQESIRRHQLLFDHPPHLVTGDRGVHAPGNEELARQAGVRRVAVPVPGTPSAERREHEHQRWFRQARRFRAGIEGRISVLKRTGALGRCRDHGEEGFERWIGWGILGANLTTLARHQAARPHASAP